MFPAIRTLFNLLLAFRTNTPGHFIVVRQWASKRKPLNPFAESSEKPEAPTMITTDTGGARSTLIGLMQIGGIVLVIALAVMVSEHRQRQRLTPHHLPALLPPPDLPKCMSFSLRQCPSKSQSPPTAASAYAITLICRPR